ncbi:WG repeat-containing protein [Roseivirga pacifica]|uniref:WG repeat-containing protein n=1 Tax=Roseivirga pacifica TaxID=1267423 RepID=UPI002095E64B|nr:WG repeat-containing protein [Roseivirga pacifica]MCO6357849.1 hypothetical protein [Roseivirga pacifica]MCO6366101.1 hypothetical protein [Roseivirga pacifica]MCO6371429.1 hypothetical protein [Roseivirga pacifica]MCO6375399.1 hypothetical protein [Roseivirga pacifica]MCO6378807.1 hypothetical protein [Roseivirga pacifica]
MPLTRLFITLFFCCFSLSVSAFQLVPYEVNGRLGLIDTAKVDTIFTAQFEAFGWSNQTFDPSAQVFGAQLNEKWALVNNTGKKLTQHLYTDLYPWQNGQLIGSTRATNSVWLNYGTLTTKGKVQVPFEHLTLTPNGDQLIVSKKLDTGFRKGVLNSNGKPIIPLNYEDIEALGSDRYTVREPDGLSALFTKEGEQLSGFEFEEISAHSNELLAVTYYNRKGIIDKSGKVVITPIYKQIEISKSSARVMGFRNWDYFKIGESQKSFNFDQISQLAANAFAISTGNNIAIIDKNENYLSYLVDHTVEDSNDKGIVIKNRQQGYYGLLNTKGSSVLPTNFDSIRLYQHFALAKIHRNDGQHWFAYDFEGNKINQNGYSEFKPFSEGKFIAKRGEKFGLVSTFGEELTTFQYDSISDFNKGLAIVKSRGLFGVINESGIWVITPYKDWIHFYDDLIYFQQGSEYGIANRAGNTIFRSYDKISPLPQGFYKTDSQGYKVFDLNGNQLLEHNYDTVRPLNKAMWLLERNEQFYLFRPEDRADFKLPEGTQQVANYSEQHIKIYKDNQWGFVGEMGHLNIANRYDSIGDFSEGLCPVKLIGNWGVINFREEIVVQPVFKHIAPFYNGMATVTTPNNEQGLIDSNGAFILEPKYTQLIRTTEGIILQIGNAFGLADSNGKLIRMPQYDSISKLDSGYFQVEKNGMFGVISLKGEDVVPTAYESIQQFKDAFLGSKASQWESIRLSK